MVSSRPRCRENISSSLPSSFVETSEYPPRRVADDRDHFLEVLASVLSSTYFHPHEYSELVLPTVESEARAALASPSTLALDLAHNLAFRRGLGNSLFASPHSPVTASDVKAYAQQAFSKTNISVLGSGISTDALSKAVQSAFGSGSAGSPTLSSGSSEYFGGESRVPLDLHADPNAQPTMVIAYGASGAPTADMKVLPYIIGGDSSVKWTPGTSELSIRAAGISGASAQSFILPYSDAALLGVVLTAPTSEVLRDLANVVVDDLSKVQNGKLGKDIVKRSVAKAKFAEATRLERTDTMVASAGPAVSALDVQANPSKVSLGNVPAPDSSFAALDKVSETSIAKVLCFTDPYSDTVQAAKDLLRKKPTVIAVGDLHKLPYM